MVSRETRRKMRVGHRRPSSEETLSRRGLLKSLIVDKGFSPSDLKGLHGELVKAGLDVTDQVLVRDCKVIFSVGVEEVKGYKEKIVKVMERYIRELELMVAGESDSGKKGVLIKTLFGCIEKQSDILCRFGSGQFFGEDKGGKDERVVFTLGDPTVIGEDGVESGF